MYYLVCFITRGSFLHSTFRKTDAGQFSDYFSMIWVAQWNPYTSGQGGNYPALACLVYDFLSHIIPIDMYGKSLLSTREIQYAWIGFCLYNIVILYFFHIIVQKYCQWEGWIKEILVLTLLISFPVMFTLERGNIILLSFVLTLFFVSFYKNENKIVCEIAYISLAIAAGIKIYPAIFGLLLLDDKKNKNVIKLLIYGVSFFFIPFLFYGGIDAFKKFYNLLIGFSQRHSQNMRNGFGMNISFINICQTFEKILHINMSDTFIRILFILTIIALLISFFLIKEKYIKLLCLSILLIVIPRISYMYTSLFLLIPFIEFLNYLKLNYYTKDNKISTFDKIYAIVAVIQIVPCVSRDIPQFASDFRNLSFYYLLYYLSIIWQIVMIISQGIKNKKAKDIYCKCSGAITILFSVVIWVNAYI